ncbi:MAG: type II toxin-antitoxin system RelE/ParE family toxin [Verrucomicrobia bacterium]|nr:type II toxin-antitoxin system RelE/ParE family toxin [Verrucomicrobiota bacterium]
MEYRIVLKRKAVKDLQDIPLEERTQIITRIELLSNNLAGDVKKLTNFTPEYRLRWGHWRILFEIEADTVIIYRVLHRRESYR